MPMAVVVALVDDKSEMESDWWPQPINGTIRIRYA